jgi:hypothetical protein
MQDQGKIKKPIRTSGIVACCQRARWPAIKCRTRLERTLGK